LLDTIRTILVPVDFSEASLQALRMAGNIARTYGATIHLLHVYQDVFSVISMRTFELTEEVVEQAIRLEISGKFEALLNEVHPDTTVLREMRKGDTADEILDYAQTRHMDLIVIATNARTGLEHLFIGSIAQRIVRSAPCPVLTCRAGADS
jgi:universal stress protein A